MACGNWRERQSDSENTAYVRATVSPGKRMHRNTRQPPQWRKISLRLPSEIRAAPLEQSSSAPDLEAEDFFAVKENRPRILAREGHRCFYCLRQLNGSNYVIEQVVLPSSGGNGFGTVVAACRHANNRKKFQRRGLGSGSSIREGFLEAADFQQRVSQLERLRAGELEAPGKVRAERDAGWNGALR